MRTRARLLATFMAVHVAIVILGGMAASWALQTFLQKQAERSAQDVAAVLAGGGFSPSPAVLERMQRLTGYAFSIDEAPITREGSIGVQVGGVHVAVDYRTEGYRTAQRLIVAGTLAAMGIGILLQALVAWWLARGIALPLETLAEAARRIGGGDFAQVVPAVGGGEIAELARTLETTRAQLGRLTSELRENERLGTLGLFTATVAHEVRNPLSAVRLSVQLLARKHPDEAALAMIENELERLDLTVDELLSYSRGMKVEPSRSTLRPLVEDVFRLLRRQAEHAGVELLCEGDATLQADPARLRQMLLNLVLNAIQAQHGGGAVRVLLAKDGFAVEDDGPGMSAATAADCFEPFSSGRKDGTGLGLHLARAIAQAHGGDLRYENADTGGARFVFSLM